MAENKLTYSQILGNIIREIVIENFDGTLTDFAIKSGVGHTVFFNLINGKVQNPSARQIARIAWYLDILPSVIYDRPELTEYNFADDDPDDPDE